jgi:hypothetical protein
VLAREALGLQGTEPNWLDRPAMSRITVSKPATWGLLRDYNKGKPYAEQIKPTNFLIASHAARFGDPIGVDRTHFDLVAQFEDDYDKWLDIEYVSRHSGKRHRISTIIPMGTEVTERVRTCRECHERLEGLAALVEAEGMAGAARELGVNERTVRRWLRR